VFVGGTCGSIHVESFNRNMKALGVLESKWDPICMKLMRPLLEEQDKVLRSYFAQMGGTRSKGEDRSNCKGREHVQHVCVKMARARILAKCQTLASVGSVKIGGILFVYYFLWIS